MMFWLRLPKELQLNILHRLLASPLPIDHAAHTNNLVCGELEIFISTNNTVLVILSLEAYYKANTFVIKAKTMYSGVEEMKTFRPREKSALQMQHIIDETAPAPPAAGIPAPIDSGYASRGDTDGEAEGAAPDVADLACALAAAVVDGDPAVKRGYRQIKLLGYVNSKGWYLRSQRKNAFWREVSTGAVRTTWRNNRPHAR